MALSDGGRWFDNPAVLVRGCRAVLGVVGKLRGCFTVRGAARQTRDKSGIVNRDFWDQLYSVKSIGFVCF